MKSSKQSLENLLAFHKYRKTFTEPIRFRYLHQQSVEFASLNKEAQSLRKMDANVRQAMLDFKTLLGKYGLASGCFPQFGQLFQVFALLREDALVAGKWLNYANAQPEHYRVVVNPKILSISMLTEYDWEACSAFDQVKVAVPRPIAVKAEFCDEDLVKHRLALRGFAARVFLHEFDHMRGRNFHSHILQGSPYQNVKQFCFAEYSNQFDFADIDGQISFAEFLVKKEKNFGEDESITDSFVTTNLRELK